MRSKRWAPGVLAGALAFCLLLAGRNQALAHATLLSSEPKANALLSASPARIRLVFSEAVVAELSNVDLHSARASIRLQVRVDPRDVHALLASPAVLAPGAYRVTWRIVSADGHPVEGDFSFIVGSAAGAAAAAAALPPGPDEFSHEDSSGPTVAGAPIVPSLLRGAGLAAMLAVTGLLMFVVRSGSSRAPSGRAARLAPWLAVAAAALLAGHLAMWLVHAAPPEQLTQSWLEAAMSTTVGRMEAVRVALALLTLWALALARRPAVALFFAGACLVVSGGIGHSAAIAPAVAIPSKAIHLLAIATWLGGLVWLTVAERDNEASFRRECHRVSATALWAVVAITITGALQSFLFLGGLSRSLWISPYGVFVAAKIFGLLLLTGFGAYHRLKILPALDAGAPGAKLRGSVKREAMLLIVVVLIGGVMAYVPTPHAPGMPITASGDR